MECLGDVNLLLDKATLVSPRASIHAISNSGAAYYRSLQMDCGSVTKYKTMWLLGLSFVDVLAGSTLLVWRAWVSASCAATLWTSAELPWMSCTMSGSCMGSCLQPGLEGPLSLLPPLLPPTASPTAQVHTFTPTAQVHTFTPTLQVHTFTATAQVHMFTSTPQLHTFTPTVQVHTFTPTAQVNMLETLGLYPACTGGCQTLLQYAFNS